MKLLSKEQAIKCIVEKYNFWGSIEDYPPQKPIHNAYFEGKPTIVSEEEIEGRKVWSYYWPQQKDEVLWLLDDGQRITSQVDVFPTVQIQETNPDFRLE